MAYRITRHEKFIEVQVTGKTSKSEIIRIILELDRRDPRKSLPDLWVFDAESQIPFTQFREVAQSVRALLPQDSMGNPTAIVAADDLQGAQMELYRAEASILPFEIRVFRSRDDAVEWLTRPDGRG